VPEQMEDGQWYKGNTHTHTTVSDGDTDPDAVARWYLDRGYNFLCLTDHNKYVDPATVSLPANRREDFILIPGEEVSGPRAIHTTALNIPSLVDWNPGEASNTAVVQYHVDQTRNAGGQPILNHPNFHFALSAADLLPVERLHLFELYNGHPQVFNNGDAEHPSTEELWDALLSAGRRVYAVSSDDAHRFKKWSADQSNAGRGWLMVRAAELTPVAITNAIRDGQFYATTGVILSEVILGDDRIAITVDEAATDGELQSQYLVPRQIDGGAAGYRIDFIGEHGRLLQSFPGTRAEFDAQPVTTYVRCKVTYRRAVAGGFEEYYAWTQPVFRDGR